LKLCRRVRPPTSPATYPPPTFPTSAATTAAARIQPTLPILATSIERPKTKKKSAAKTSRKLKKRSSISSRTDVSDRTTPAISAPIASDRPTSLARQPVEQPIDQPAQPLRDGERGSDEGDRLADQGQRLTRGAAASGGEPEHEPDREVLRDQDRQHEIGLVVGQAAEVDEPLDGDRARGDVDRRGEDERAEADPERRDPDDQAEAGVGEEVDRPADERVLAAAHEPVERELEAQEEEQEHEADLGQEVRHLGGTDEAERLRLVRSEQQAREQVGRNRGQAGAARDEPESGK
jgi:hypothetical protein